jgi:negative modulator of initiation of replication
MKHIEIDDDLYHFIASQTQHIGESASDILRRLVMPNSVATLRSSSQASIASQVSSHSVNPQAQCLLDAAQLDLSNEPKVVSRFLRMLALLHHHHQDDFAKVLSMGGRNRTYFATSKETLLASGSSTNPKAIADSTYWVITNNNTAKKVTMLTEVAQLLDYSEQQVTHLINLFYPESAAESTV